jgi:periplasmic divalent cation tolerance protein
VTDKIIVYVTTGKMTEARKIARALVEKRLAACVNVIPKVTSVYRWKDELQTDEEFLLIIKTRRARFDELRKCIETLHSYEIPEVIATPIVDGSANYLNWIEQSVPE